LRRHSPQRPPALRDALGLEPARPRGEAERVLQRRLHGDVAGREGVGAAMREQQEDLGRPGADAGDREQRRPRLVLGQLAERRHVEPARDRGAERAYRP
jgi:hypothetical protein